MLQQLHPGQQEQGTELLGQEYETQLQQRNSQFDENVRQHNEQGFQLQLQQYQVQQEVYLQLLQQQNLQQHISNSSCKIKHSNNSRLLQHAQATIRRLPLLVLKRLRRSRGLNR